MIRRLVPALLVCGALLGCAAGNPPNAAATDVASRAYAHDGPAEVMLVTMRDVRSDGGAHTALMINGAQRVIWDPAGSFEHPHVPEVDDVLYGITPLIETVYVDYHVRPQYYMIQQRLSVSPEMANRLIRLAEAEGRAPRATCARKTSSILREAGIDVKRTWFPIDLMRAFAEVPGVRTERVDMTNVDTDHNVVFGKGGVPIPPA